MPVRMPPVGLPNASPSHQSTKGDLSGPPHAESNTTMPAMPAARMNMTHLLGRESIIFGSKEESAMSRIRLALLTGGALVAATAALITWRARQGRSPLESLQQLADAVRAKDRPGIEQFLDVRRAAESVVDEALSTAAALDPGATSELQSFEGMRPSMAALVELNIWTTLLDPAAPQREDAALDLRTLIDRYQGIAGVQQEGAPAVARVGVRIGQRDGDSTVVVHLRMEPAAEHWRIVAGQHL